MENSNEYKCRDESLEKRKTIELINKYKTSLFSGILTVIIENQFAQEHY